MVPVLVTYSAGERDCKTISQWQGKIQYDTIQYNTKSNSCGIVFPWSLTISILSNCYKNSQTFDTIFKQSIDISISLILFSQWRKVTFLNLRDIATTECLLRHKTVIATIVCIGILQHVTNRNILSYAATSVCCRNAATFGLYQILRHFNWLFGISGSGGRNVCKSYAVWSSEWFTLCMFGITVDMSESRESTVTRQKLHSVASAKSRWSPWFWHLL
jgi:hypothetical protein